MRSRSNLYNWTDLIYLLRYNLNSVLQRKEIYETKAKEDLWNYKFRFEY